MLIKKKIKKSDTLLYYKWKEVVISYLIDNHYIMHRRK